MGQEFWIVAGMEGTKPTLTYVGKELKQPESPLEAPVEPPSVPVAASGGVGAEITPPKPPNAPESKRSEAVKSARIALGKDANGMILALDAACYVNRCLKQRHNVELGMDALERVAIHFKMNLDRHGLTNLLPAEPMEPVK
jgi:hypothetical protein